MTKILIVLSSLAVLILAILWGVGFFLAAEDKPAPADFIVVISGGDTKSRVSKGVELYRSGYADRIVFSGTAAEGTVPDAKVMGSIAIREGVPADAIVYEDKAHDTFENAVFTKELLQGPALQSCKDGTCKLILVTSPYHLRRAGIIFRTVFKGADVTKVAAADKNWSKKAWFLSKSGVRLTLAELAGIAYFYLNQKPSLEIMEVQNG